MAASPGRSRRVEPERGARARWTAALAAALAAGLAGVAEARPGVLGSGLRARAAAQGAVRVIVGVSAPCRPEGELTASARSAQRAGISSAQARVLATLAGTGHRATHAFRTIPYVALEAPPAALDALEAHGLVRSVQEDRPEPPLLASSVPFTRAPPAWAAGLDGSGQVVAVLDTGVDVGHPMLSGKLVAEACFSQNGDCPNGRTSDFGPGAAAPCAYSPDCPHGTFVSGIAVGDGALAGVAPGAGLLPIQVFSRRDDVATCGAGNTPCPRSFLVDQLAALEHVLLLAESHAIAAVNLSIGLSLYSSRCDGPESARKAAIDNLRSLGIATVAASGNDANANGMRAPACISTAVSVGSVSEQDVVSSFSNSDGPLSLLAPGEGIQSSFPGGQLAQSSGTSMATAHVAGAWAVLKQHDPSASVSEVLAALAATGVPVTDARNGLTRPRIRVVEAADELACVDPDADGVCASQDLCPGFDDTADSDGDGSPDGCDDEVAGSPAVPVLGVPARAALALALAAVMAAARRRRPVRA